jgi:hypothetical protein
MTDSRLLPGGLIYCLERIHWDFFLTILLPHVRGVESRAEPIWRSFYSRLARALKIKPECLIWLAAIERGSSGINPHLHVLISGPLRGMHVAKFESLARSIARRMDLVGARAFDWETRPDGLSYFFKETDPNRMKFRLDDGRWPMCSANMTNVLRRGGRM